jgi:hypothetical protein
LQDDATDSSLLHLMDEDLDSSLWALGPFPYHVKDDGPLEPTKIGHSALLGPFELREGPKR